MKTSERITNLKASYGAFESQSLEKLSELLRFPSISADPASLPAVRECAKWLIDYLTEIGFQVSQWEIPSSGPPTVFAEYRASAAAPTVLIYNHYDVQPVDPLELWSSPPFEPEIRGGEIFARGAQDNKGQLWCVLSALKYLIEVEGGLPLNVKLVIEGEEEIGSPGLISILPERKAELRADYLLIVDCGIPAMTRPTVTGGLRGALMMTVTAQGSKIDLHSGQHGGVAFNPNHALIQILASLRSESGEILIPGFYDGVTEISAEERELFDFSFDEKDYRSQFGCPATGGESGLTPNERRWLRPSLEINGIGGGYSGPGFKTVIPAEAKAKLSCRLVPGQDPERILSLIIETLTARTPDGITLIIEPLSGRAPAVRTSPTSNVMKRCAQAYAETFGTDCKFVLEGWSVPVTSFLTKTSGAEVAMIGLALPDDQIHAPNERFSLERLKLGFVSTVRMLELLGGENSGED